MYRHNTDSSTKLATDIQDGPLQSSWVVIHIIGAKRQHAHEEEEQETVHPPPRVTRKECFTVEPEAG